MNTRINGKKGNKIMENKNYLITWFYAEQSGNESFYPSVGGNTSSPKFQEVYWKCVYDFYKSAQLVGGEEVKLMFFTNVPNIPTCVDGVNIAEYFREASIEVVRLELSNKTPIDWYGAWRNQFYLFDILQYLEDRDGNYIILDSDCIIRKSLSPVFKSIEKNKIITYDCKYSPNHDINGISINKMKFLYKEFYNEEAPELSYKGGEFVGVSGEIIKDILREYRLIWNLNYKKYEEKGTKLNEEAHFLSLIYYRLGITESVADRYIKRMWTALKCDNIDSFDKNLAIWHLPAEKKYGFLKLFKWFANKNITPEEYLNYSSTLLSIPGNVNARKFQKFIWKIQEKFGK